MSEFDTLATLEMERHRGQMLYAERKLLKAGDYETVTRSRLERSHFRLFGCSAAMIAMLVPAILQQNFLSVGFGAVILVTFGFDYAHAKRTHQTILRLKEATDASDAARAVAPSRAAVS